jgi:Bleomycin resistance protein-like N-terminal
MPGQIVHFEIPADDTAKSREFWGSLFGWQFESYPGPFEYYMTRISDQGGRRSPTWSRQARHACLLRRGRHQRQCGARQGAEGRGGPAGPGAGHRLVRDLPGPAGQRVRPVADRPIRSGTSGVNLAAATHPEGHQPPSATLGEMRLELSGLGNRGQSNSEQIISLCLAATAASPRSRVAPKAGLRTRTCFPPITFGDAFVSAWNGGGRFPLAVDGPPGQNALAAGVQGDRPAGGG